MRTTVNTDDSNLAAKFRAADESLRKSYAALDINTFMHEVKRSMNDLDIDLPDKTLRDYAQHIADRADYELVLTSS